jgi:hypothetical protein
VGIQAQERSEKPTGSAASGGGWMNLYARCEKNDFHAAKSERPFSRLGEQLGLRAGRVGQMRPLGSHFMVDQNGIIWMEEKPVGVWGVNGSTPAAFPGRR